MSVKASYLQHWRKFILKQMIVFFQTRLRKILIWEKFLERESSTLMINPDLIGDGQGLHYGKRNIVYFFKFIFGFM